MIPWSQQLVLVWRKLLAKPGFATIAVLTLALGIGANAAIFTIVHSVLLEPLPYAEPSRMVTIWSQWTGFPKTWLSLAEYRLVPFGWRCGPRSSAAATQ